MKNENIKKEIESLYKAYKYSPIEEIKKILTKNNFNFDEDIFIEQDKNTQIYLLKNEKDDFGFEVVTHRSENDLFIVEPKILDKKDIDINLLQINHYKQKFMKMASDNIDKYVSSMIKDKKTSTDDIIFHKQYFMESTIMQNVIEISELPLNANYKLAVQLMVLEEFDFNKRLKNELENKTENKTQNKMKKKL